MAKVLLLSSAPPDDPSRPYPYDELNRMKRSAERDKYGTHRLTEDPEHADVILFVENCDTIRHYLEVRNHAYLRDYREKCFLFSKYDYPLPFLPGVYASISKRWYDRQRTRSGPYLKAIARDYIEPDLEPEQQKYLYSFLGAANNHPVREALFQLDHEAQYLLDTSASWPYGDMDEKQQKEFQERYAEVTRRSKFVLCPRGKGVSSIRLFESMCIGRAPVIISDQWVPPRGPDWDAFAVRIAEKNIHRIPKILSTYEDRAAAMGRKARQAWEDYFSVEAIFHYAVNQCLDIKQARKFPESLLRYQAFLHLLRPLHAKALVRKLWRQ